jgi:hypothetical protein
MLGCERHLVSLVPHQASWADLFRREASALKPRGYLLRISDMAEEHVMRTPPLSSPMVAGWYDRDWSSA